MHQACVRPFQRLVESPGTDDASLHKAVLVRVVRKETDVRSVGLKSSMYTGAEGWGASRSSWSVTGDRAGGKGPLGHLGQGCLLDTQVDGFS